MPDPEPDDRTTRLGAMPRRLRRVVARILRHPAATMEQFVLLREHVDLTQRSTHQLASEHAAERDSLRHDMQLLRHAVHVLTLELANVRHDLTARENLAHESWDRIGTTMGALVEHVATSGADGSATDGPLVSIVVPVRDRPEQLRQAVRSVLAQTYQGWELVIVDDGSVVPVSLVLGIDLDDPRIRVVRIDPSGASVARNRGLRECAGALVAFLDSDNWWLPSRLADAVDGLPPAAGWAFDQQLVLDSGSPPQYVRNTLNPLSELADANFIDLGTVLVRRTLLEQLGDGSGPGLAPFDESLPRLADWDLVIRLNALTPPARIPRIGQVYDGTRPDRISSREPWGPAFHAIRRRVIGQPAAGLRVLVSEWHFPQVTETYIQADIVGLRALGAEVEVWSDEGVAAAYEPGVTWRRGDLAEHIADFRPNLVLTHWLHVGRDHREVTRSLGIPHAVRCHGFDHNDEVIAELARDPGVALHLFPHMMGGLEDHPNVTAHPVGFDPERISPTADKDRTLVVRLSAGLLTKDLDTFFLTARRCPDFRFVLGVGHAYQAEHKVEELIQRAQELGSPVEIVTDLGYGEAAELTARAGIYLHTHGVDHVLGMPISPIEAMASGSLVLARSLNGSDYLASGAIRYDGTDAVARADRAAAIVNATTTWSDERWADQRRRALDAAWGRHPADLVVHELLTAWTNQFGAALSRRSLPSGAR
ncbi:MAG: glycosyltransferase [Microthrixaceae bacterium]